jgi:hypothetical protein
MGLSKYSLIVGLLSDSGIELPIVGFFSRIVGFLLRVKPTTHYLRSMCTRQTDDWGIKSTCTRDTAQKSLEWI